MRMGIFSIALPSTATVLVMTTITGCEWLKDLYDDDPTPPSQTTEAPEFIRFSTNNTEVCLNQGPPFIRISFEVALNDWSNPNTLCVDLYANDININQDSQVHHQCMNDGTSGERTLLLNEFFGSNIPSTIEIRGELVPQVAGETQDIRTVTVTTILNCPPPSPVPGG